MAVGWYTMPLVAHPTRGARYAVPAFYSRLSDLHASGGRWSAAETLGRHLVVKVSAPPAALAVIDGLPNVTRIPLNRIDDPLSSLTAGQRTALRNWVLSLGYTSAEINAALPGALGGYTLRQLLTFAISRRRKPRWDPVSGAVVADGPVQPPRRSIESLDREVV